MRTSRLLVFILALIAASAATAFYVDLPIAATTKTGFNTVNPNIRGQDGKLVPSKLSTLPQLGEISVDDGTGITLTTPSAAVVKDNSLTVAGNVRGSLVIDPVNGTLTVKSPGLYRICFYAGDGVGANTGVQTLTVFQNVNAGGAAELSPSIKAISTTLTAQPWIPLNACGMVSIAADKAAGSGNVVFDVRATSSTGNMTLKRFRFSAQKVDELDPPSP